MRFNQHRLMTRETGERWNITEHCPLPFHKGATGALVPFHNSIMGHFIVYKTTWNKFIAAIRAPRKFRMVFYNFCYYFWGHNCCWTEISIIGNDFFALCWFPLRSTLLLHPLLYRCSGVPANDSTTNVVVDIPSQFILSCLQFAMITILDYTSFQQKL